jgi:hypothetical protein
MLVCVQKMMTSQCCFEASAVLLQQKLYTAGTHLQQVHASPGAWQLASQHVVVELQGLQEKAAHTRPDITSTCLQETLVEAAC